MIDFSDDFFEEEIQDGFRVQACMKRFWASSVEVLMFIDEVCQKYNLKYFMYYGTLLGAVRHKGFIPWDDDMDIVMPRLDYMKFIKVVQSELRPGMVVKNVDNVFFPLRINNSTAITTEPDFLSRYHDCPYVTGIDIFVLDNIPDNKEDSDLLSVLWNSGARLAGAMRYNIKNNLPLIDDEMEEYLQMFEKVCGHNFDRDERAIGQLSYIVDRLVASYYDEPSSNMAVLCYYYQEDMNEPAVPSSFFNDVVYLPFLNATFPAPKEYDSVLKLLYGDYMKPVKGIQAHNYPCFKPGIIGLRAAYVARGEHIPESYDWNEIYEGEYSELNSLRGNSKDDI